MVGKFGANVDVEEAPLTRVIHTKIDTPSVQESRQMPTATHLGWGYKGYAGSPCTVIPPST